MNRRHYKNLRRRYKALYAKYQQQDEGGWQLYEALEALDPRVKVGSYRHDGYNLLYLWSIAKRHIAHGEQKAKVYGTFRRCIRSNTSCNGTVGQSHPCYWDGR